MSDKLRVMREIRDKVDDNFLRNAEALSRSADGVVPGVHTQGLANLALIGGRLDKMIRDEIAAERLARITFGSTN